MQLQLQLQLQRSIPKLTQIGVGLLLAGCGTAALPAQVIQPTAEDQLKATSSNDDFSLTVNITATDTVKGLEVKYGGKVLIWRPKQAYAVIGLDTLSANQVRSTSGSAKLERNKGVFSGGGQLATMSGTVSAWAGGTVSAWAGGTVSAWAGGVVSAWAGGKFVPVPQNTSKWQKMNLQAAQTAASNLGAGIKVAIIDTGIDLKHPAFHGGLVAASEMWDYVGNDAVPQEEGVLSQGAYGHGTSVAGIVLQIAPKVKLLPLRVLGSNGSGDVINVAAAINRAVDFGAKVINLSLGSDVRSEAVATAIDAATAKGVFVISSSGNTANQSITFPASQANFDTTTTGLYSLSVGSVNALDQKSSFSTYGAGLELVAPGEVVYGPFPTNRLGAWSGTSMSAPMASGALALALAQNLSVFQQDLTHKIKSRAFNIYRQGQNPAYQYMLGDGRLDIASFLSAVMF
jgi:thermitase